jgi:hypothetical protein
MCVPVPHGLQVKTEEELTNRGVLKQDDDWTNRRREMQNLYGSMGNKVG